jgi:Lrp/AsnC family transcriptional regulator for asnA, asnC and gidA
MIGINAEGDIEPVAEVLASMPEVDYVIVTAGSFDIIVEVVCESDDHLLELLSKRIRSISGVHSTETFVYLKLHKQTYSWGVR